MEFADEQHVSHGWLVFTPLLLMVVNKINLSFWFRMTPHPYSMILMSLVILQISPIKVK
jgi:hypothetical protein